MKIRPEHQHYEERYRVAYAAGVPVTKTTGDFGPYERFLREQPARGRLVDLGCGEGRAAALAAELGYDVLALDSSPSVIAKARALHGERFPCIAFELADVCELDAVASASAEIAVDLGCLHLIKSDEDARQYLSRVFRALKPGGLMYLQELVPADDAEAWCPWEAERVAWWRERTSRSDPDDPVKDTYEVEGRAIEVVRPSTPTAFREVRQHVSLLTGAGFRVQSARVVTPGANSPFEVILVTAKSPAAGVHMPSA